MSNEKTGGAAFPWCGDLNACPTINLGMTMRDYFAAKAMQSLLVSDLTIIAEGDIVLNEAGDVSVSRTAYRMADAMLEARAK